MINFFPSFCDETPMEISLKAVDFSPEKCLAAENYLQFQEVHELHIFERNIFEKNRKFKHKVYSLFSLHLMTDVPMGLKASLGKVWIIK